MQCIYEQCVYDGRMEESPAGSAKKGCQGGKEMREPRMLLGEGAGHSEDALVFGASLPGTFGFGSRGFPAVFSPCAKTGSRAIKAPLKNPRSRGGFCYPSVILFGKRGPDFRYFPCLLCNLIVHPALSRGQKGKQGVFFNFLF